MRRLFLLCALLLTACGQDGGQEAFTDSRLPPSITPRFYPPEGWAWGLVQAGEFPAQRYGVSAPATAPTAHLLILPGYGESAEAWFETAADLNRRGYAVWVLEAAGQGGSGRFALPRDVGHIPSLEPDLMAVKAMLRVVIPQDDRPVVVLGQQSGGLLAILAAQRGWTGDGLIVSATGLPPAASPLDDGITRASFGWLRDPREPSWSRETAYRTGPPGADPFRNAVQQAWQQANPDLRMAGPSVGRRVVMAQAGGWALAALPGIPRPVLVIGGPAFGAACARAASCESRPAPPGAKGPYSQLEADGPRGAWLTSVDGFVRDRRAERLAAQGSASHHGE
jgi:lysophospholipase